MVQNEGVGWYGEWHKIVSKRGPFLDVLCDFSVNRRDSDSLAKKAISVRKKLGVRGVRYFDSGESIHRLVLGSEGGRSEASEVYSIISNDDDDVLKQNFRGTRY